MCIVNLKILNIKFVICAIVYSLDLLPVDFFFYFFQTLKWNISKCDIFQIIIKLKKTLQNYI